MTWFQMESEVNDMSPKNDFSDIFDDDFEVTYEEDPEINFHTSEDTKQINRPDSNTETIVMNADDYRDNFNDSDDSQFEEVLPEYDDDYEDDDADYETWEMYELRERVRLVQEFDQLADRMVDQAIHLAKTCVVEEEEYLIPQRKKVLVSTGA